MTNSPSSSKKASNQTIDISPLINSGNNDANAKKETAKGSARRPNTAKSVKESPSSSQGNISSSDGGANSLNSNKGFSYSSGNNKGIALGLIETRGMVPAIEAADAMTKAAEVVLIAKEFVGGGYVTVMVRGETGAVNASVRAGADACERVGDGLVAAHIIARPHTEIEPVLTPSGAKRRY